MTTSLLLPCALLFVVPLIACGPAPSVQDAQSAGDSPPTSTNTTGAPQDSGAQRALRRNL
jgi:hypothetical protein